jgi:hypothetical protein
MRHVIQLFDSERIEALEGMCVIERTMCGEPAKLRDLDPTGYAMQTVLVLLVIVARRNAL